MPHLDSNLNPVTSSHIFWKRKSSFELPTDTYEEWVLFAVTEGSFRFEVAQSKGQASFGDLVICPPWTPFVREVLEPLSFHFFRFQWNLEGTGDLQVPLGGKLAIRDHNRLASTYYYLDKLVSSPTSPSYLSRAEHLLRDLWQLCCLESEQDSDASDASIEEEEMLEAARWIRENAFGKAVLKDLALSMGLSPVQFTRHFQAYFGQSPMDYITALRLHQAKNLLLETNLTLEQVAEQCGYQNGFYLSRMFSKKFNVSPSNFRKSNRV